MKRPIIAFFLALFVAGTLGAVDAHFGPLAAVGTFAALNLAALPFASPGSAVVGLQPFLKMPDFTGNMATSGKVACLFPNGVAYHKAIFRFQDGGVDMTVAQIKARVETIVAKVNGKPVREWTPSYLDIANATNGAQYAMSDGYVIDYFSEDWRRTMEGEERGAWGTEGIDGITYEIKFTGTAVDPSVEAYALIEEANRPFRAYPVRHVRTYAGMVAVNGDSQWPGAGILREPGLWYDRLHFMSSLITNVDVRLNGVTKWDNIPRAYLAEILAKRGLALQANTYSLAFSGSSQQLVHQLASFYVNGSGQAVPVNDLRLKWTGTGAGNFDIVTEQYQIFK